MARRGAAWVARGSPIPSMIQPASTRAAPKPASRPMPRQRRATTRAVRASRPPAPRLRGSLVREGAMAVALEEKFAAFDDHWAPRIIAQVNGFHVKAVKVKG